LENYPLFITHYPLKRMVKNEFLWGTAPRYFNRGRRFFLTRFY
jgi:hypothetical protein